MATAALFLVRGGGVEDRGLEAEEVGKTYGGGEDSIKGSSSSQASREMASSQKRREMGFPASGRESSSLEGKRVPRDGRTNRLKRAKSSANSLMKAGMLDEAGIQTRGCTGGFTD